MDRYPNISDHGLIGDLQTAALVMQEGTIDFSAASRILGERTKSGPADAAAPGNAAARHRATAN